MTDGTNSELPKTKKQGYNFPTQNYEGCLGADGTAVRPGGSQTSTSLLGNYQRTPLRWAAPSPAPGMKWSQGSPGLHETFNTTPVAWLEEPVPTTAALTMGCTHGSLQPQGCCCLCTAPLPTTLPQPLPHSHVRYRGVRAASLSPSPLGTMTWVTRGKRLHPILVCAPPSGLSGRKQSRAPNLWAAHQERMIGIFTPQAEWEIKGKRCQCSHSSGKGISILGQGRLLRSLRGVQAQNCHWQSTEWALRGHIWNAIYDCAISCNGISQEKPAVLRLFIEYPALQWGQYSQCCCRNWWQSVPNPQWRKTVWECLNMSSVQTRHCIIKYIFYIGH